MYSLIAITFIDLKHMIIPNAITFPGIIIGLTYGALGTDLNQTKSLLLSSGLDIWSFMRIIDGVPFFNSLFGAIFGGGILFIIGFIYKIVRKREGMGMGDVKLLAMIGAFLGWQSIILVTLLSSVIGTVVGLSYVIYKKGDLKYAIPFGPFLSIAAVLYCFMDGFTLGM